MFLFLWGWRELGIRVAIERTATRDAEARLERESSARLNDQIAKLGTALSTASTVVPVSGLSKGSARLFVDDQGRGAIAISSAPKGSYELQADGQQIATIEVPKSGQKTALFDHLPAGAKAFTLTSR